MKTNGSVSVVEADSVLQFLPMKANGKTALIFFCGSGIAAEAYAPFLYPIAESGYRVYVVRLPLRFAPLESHKQEAIDRAMGLINNHPEISRWVISGHSLGAALACRAVRSNDSSIVGVVLIGTTHPKADDLSGIPLPVTKVYASKDGVAPMDDVLANKKLLPASTTWVEIDGGNHSQFGHYGHQLFDGTATISRSEQQRIARSAVLNVLQRVDERIVEQ